MHFIDNFINHWTVKLIAKIIVLLKSIDLLFISNKWTEPFKQSSLFSLSANIDVMHVGRLLFIGGDWDWWGDGGFRHLLYFNSPLIFWFLEVAQPVLGLAVWYTNIHTSLGQYSIDLWYHFACIGSWVLSALFNEP